MIRSDEHLDEVILEAFSLLKKRGRTWVEEDRLQTIGDMIQKYEDGLAKSAARHCLEGAVCAN